MFVEDYILRQISLLVAVLAKIAGLKQAGQYQEAFKLIDQSIEETFGLEAGIVRQLDDNDLIDLLPTENGIDLVRVFALADLLGAEGDVLAAQHRSRESRESHQRALDLFLKLSARSVPELEQDVALKIIALQKKLA